MSRRRRAPISDRVAVDCGNIAYGFLWFYAAKEKSVASLFTYMGITAVGYTVIRFVPPFGGERTGS